MALCGSDGIVSVGDLAASVDDVEGTGVAGETG